MAMVMENQLRPLARMPPLVVVPAPPPLPPPPPPPQAYKHRCKVCKKGFVCGRALGGHMRAHGVTDDALSGDATVDDDAIGAGDDSSDTGSAPAAARRMYALRTNPGRLKSCRVCENCGKEFTSWKSLLDHGRCHYDEEEGGGNFGVDDDADKDGDEEGEDLALAGGWSKGKRTRRAKVMVVGNGTVTEEQLQVPAPSSEEEDLANFLVMLSSSSSSSSAAAARPHRVVVEVDQQETCVAISRMNEQSNHHQHQLLVPQPISMVAPAAVAPPPQLKLLAPPPQVVPVPAHHAVSTVPRGMFECKACKKVFTSHQALGGHRASHKKVKGCFAAKLESNSNSNNRNEDPPPQPVIAAASAEKAAVIVNAIQAAGVDTADNSGAAVVVMATATTEMVATDEVPSAAVAASFKKKGKVHECSICHRVFMSGQALGGHKRCHWLTTGGGDPSVAKLQPYVTQDHVMHAMCQQLTLGRPAAMFDASSDPFLDLNVPTKNPSPAVARQAAAAAELNDGVLSLTAPAAELYMQSWHSNTSNMNNTATSGHYDAAAAEAAATEDEADSTSAKRAKISDLKDMNMGGETSPWLQVGIGLPSEIDEEKATTTAA
ncbi:unnamed protein product [Urochloa humidicola]